MTPRPSWTAGLALAASLVASPAQAHEAERPFVGQVVAGIVTLRAPRQPITDLAFVAETQATGTIRFRAMTCVYDDCTTRTLIIDGAIRPTGSQVEVVADHPGLGRITLAGPIVHNGPGHNVCDAKWGPPREEPHQFAYTSTGDTYRVTWSGRVGSKSARAASEFICGRYLNPGVIDVA